MADGEKLEILAVDLDGTLVRTDMLYESFWSALAGSYWTPFRALADLVGGRARLKEGLAKRCTIDVALLPYDEEVIARIKAWRNAGGRTALVTASDQKLAEDIADHLGIFDEVHGSDGKRNLKGARKADHLNHLFGAQGYSYVGDHPSDLAVWRSARKAISVGASASLKRSIGRIQVPHEAIERNRSLKDYVRAIRVHQWSKNVLVFLPILAAHDLTTAALLKTVIAFFAFSFIASGIYVINDLVDLASDRAHPRKKNRPFASGRLPIAHGTFLTLAMLGSGAVLSSLLGAAFAATMLGYVLLTTAYSLQLKRRAIIDISTLSLLYVVRIIAGSAATETPLTVWLLAFALFFFFSLAAVKRQAELVDAVETGRAKAHGRGYWPEDLMIVSQLATAAGFLSVLVLALYINSEKVVVLYRRPEVLFGICIVLLYWISRVIMITHRGFMHDDPIVFAAKDRNSYVCGALIALLALLSI